MIEAEGGRKARLRERLAESRATFVAAARALSAEELGRTVGHDSHWTAKDLLGHVAYAEAGMLPMIAGPPQGRAPEVAPDFDIDRWNEGRVRRAREQTVAQLLARLEESRGQALALLDGLTDADLDRPVTHPVAGDTTVEGIFRIIAHHERTHAKDLRAVHDGTPATGAGAGAGD